MSTDLWEQLADAPVPPAPEAPAFEHGVTERINTRLLWLHGLEFVFKTVPFALWHFAGGVFGVLSVTLTGKFPPNPEKRGEESDQSEV